MVSPEELAVGGSRLTQGRGAVNRLVRTANPLRTLAQTAQGARLFERGLPADEEGPEADLRLAGSEEPGCGSPEDGENLVHEALIGLQQLLHLPGVEPGAVAGRALV